MRLEVRKSQTGLGTPGLPIMAEAAGPPTLKNYIRKYDYAMCNLSVLRIESTMRDIDLLAGHTVYVSRKWAPSLDDAREYGSDLRVHTVRDPRESIAMKQQCRNRANGPWIGDSLHSISHAYIGTLQGTEEPSSANAVAGRTHVGRHG